jgi:hypothetical protein
VRPSPAPRWTRPGRRPARRRGAAGNLEATTDSQGRATFSVKKSRGTHTIRVVGVAKSGFDYDELGSVISKSLYVRR